VAVHPVHQPVIPNWGGLRAVPFFFPINRKYTMAEGHGLHVEFSIESKLISSRRRRGGRSTRTPSGSRSPFPATGQHHPEREATTRTRALCARIRPVQERPEGRGAGSRHPAEGMWPAMSRAMARSSRFNVHTVEQLAACPTAMQRSAWAPGNGKPRPRPFWKLGKDTGAAQKYAVENEDLKREMADFAASLPSCRTADRARKARTGPAAQA
jgi:hypothetical protein